MTQKNIKKKRLTKRMYVFLAFVTMAAVSLFAKPIKRGFSTLKTHLTKASSRANFRQDLKLYSKQRRHRALSSKKQSRSKQHRNDSSSHPY